MDQHPLLKTVRRAGFGVTAGVLGLLGCGDNAAPAAEEVAPLKEWSVGGGARYPHLSSSDDGVMISWWTPVSRVPGSTPSDGAAAPAGPPSAPVTAAPPGGADPDSAAEGDLWALMALPFTSAALRDNPGLPVEVVRGEDFFVNWADFPSVVEVASDRWVAHWLERNGPGTYAYGVRVSESSDRGRTWSEPWSLHDDRSESEHGFVSILPVGDGWTAIWLDGRRFASGSAGPATNEMQLRARTVVDGVRGPDVAVDVMTCDCCQTDLAITDQGVLAVYRDRSPEEIRDIHVARMVDGEWRESRPVHQDGWEISACPVNGPAVAADGSRVAVAWFTAAEDQPRVFVSFSEDGGVSFGPPIRMDRGGEGVAPDPLGRVDVELLSDGSAVVLWVEPAGPTDPERGSASGEASLLARRVMASGGAGRAFRMGTTARGRASGFPHMVRMSGDTVLTAHTVPDPDESPRGYEVVLRAWAFPLERSGGVD